MLEPLPAPDCTRTSFFAASFLTVSGVAATRVSPPRVSAGTPILMAWVSLVCLASILARARGKRPLDQLKHGMRDKCEARGGQRAGEQHHVVVQGQPLDDSLAEATGADERGDCRGADIYHRRG